jgi:hypothetical protein
MVGARCSCFGWVLLLLSSRAHARLGDSLASWAASRQFSGNETAVVVPNEFIVIFSDDEEQNELDYDAVEQRAVLVARLLGARILYIYHYTFQGVALAVDSNSTSTATTRSTETVLTLSRAQSILSRAQTRRHSLFRAIEEACFWTDFLFGF